MIEALELSPALQALWEELGIEPHFFEGRKLCIYPEAKQFVEVDDIDGPYRICPEVLSPWLTMRDAAKAEGLNILMVSAFRSYEYQAGLIRRKLEQNIPIQEALTVVAAPGFSEHHTGFAIDINSPECEEAVTEYFEDTPEFTWLTQHAHKYGFYMSFPKGNPQGYIYEPWHWCWRSS